MSERKDEKRSGHKNFFNHSGEISLNDNFRFLKRRQSLMEKITGSSHPGRILIAAFAVLIVIGSLLLSTPPANAAEHVSYINHLFTAVSAVCVTGLSTVTAATQYTTFGKVILIILMELGGLGPMTVVAVFLANRRKRMAMSEKKFFAAASGKSNLHDVPRYIRRIFLYTFVFELAGFILLSFRMTEVYGLKTGLFNALFLSVSAFTNAGFDPIGSSSLLAYAADPLVNLTVMTLIIFGGLGFVVWFELYDLLKSRFVKGNGIVRRHTYLSVHAKTVLKMTVSLLFSGAVLFYVFESENSGTIAGLDGLDRMLICLFQSVTLRTAGFATVNFGRCTRPMLMIMCFYMLTGGSPGGTAGGMKTTTVAVLSATASNTLKGNQNDAMISNRRISPEMLKQAFVVLYLYLATLFISLILLTVFEPGQDLLLLVFEAFSAIGTVGISAGITSSLSTGGRFVIMMLMFIGRLGPLSIYTAFQKEKKIITHVTYPDADIMIG